MTDKCALGGSERTALAQGQGGYMGREHLLEERLRAADEASVITPSAHVSVHLGHMPVNTWLHSLTKRTQNPVMHALIIAKQVSLAAQTGPHITETTLDKSCVQTPNQMHFGLSMASSRLLLTTKLTWKCLHHCEYRGRNDYLTGNKNVLALILAISGNSTNVHV